MIENGRGRGRRALIHRTDLALALLVLLICGVLWYVTSRFEEVPAVLRQGVLPTDFPRLVLGVIIVLTLLLPFEHIAHTRRGSDIDEERSVSVKPISMLTAALLVLLVAVMIPLGTLLTMVVACAVMPFLWGERRIRVIALYAILFPLGVTLLFEQGLQVRLPAGLLDIPFL